MKIEYTKVGDYYLPNLYYPEETRPIGCWGMFRKEYLKEHKSGTYTYLLLTARLDSYLADLNEQAQERYELIESYYEEYQQELERFLESDPEMFSLEAEIHHYIDILEPVLRDAGQEMWQALDRIISAKNAMEGIVAKEMYIRGFLDYERLVCEKDSKI